MEVHLLGIPKHIFQLCRIRPPAARGASVEAKMAAYLHPVALQWAWGSNEGAQHRGACQYRGDIELIVGDQTQ